ncbi:MAG TPA: DUF2076 domain-containing protein [Alphaproteobacteria bacterium]|nr:DUF2076 domain-containing protein [Alphaproteobacteria bacterium]
MTPQERDLIEDLFRRLRAADTAQTDRDAQGLIGQRVGEHGTAPYLLVQTVLVQEHALANAQARISQLESDLAEARKNESRAPDASRSQPSFLGALAGSGPWGRHVDAASQSPSLQSPPQQGQSSRPQAFQAGAAGGSVPSTAAPSGGFLQSALSTAAGVAGGALLFEGIRSLFFHNPGPFGSAFGTGWGSGVGIPGPGVNETVINNYYGDDPNAGNMPNTVDTADTPDSSSDPSNANADDAGLQDASDVDSSGVDSSGDFDAGGSDFGGGDLNSI